MQPTRTVQAMGVGDIIDESFRLLRANFVTVVGITAVTLVPLGLLFLVLGIGSVGLSSRNFTTSGGAAIDTAALTGLIVGSLFAVILTLLLTVLSNAALAVAISNSYLGRRVSIGSSYTVAFGRAGALLLSGVLTIVFVVLLWFAIVIVSFGLAALLAALSANVLGVVLGVVAGFATFALFLRIVISWVLVPQAVVLERSAAMAAFSRSAGLITGHRWKAAGVLLISLLLLAILQGVPALLVGALLRTAHVDATVVTLIDNLLQLVFNVVLSPIPLAATTLLFYDLKIRKEAFDLEMLAAQLSHEPSALPG